ncbi:anaerobic ribonucleoside-triphosphate reductase activating protein [Candidatus Falkowbacteria bacterium]|nr:anaerobic ribonucleoside-triphosphate reductase activating protein [Candidatus Falkowbacteria bacterium]NCT54912.1 anaerobic ribonucleoside-triphosphate reductase activating protein [Candidatus Falkowbacteria bacterium]
MIIGGLEKLTLIDYPNHLAAIIFTFGCNFRCHYCYNPMLVLPQEGKDVKNKEDLSSIASKDLFLFLQERFGRLEGVVITGGEPTLHSDLPDFIRKIKKIGYLVKLDTNGTNPEMLEKLIKAKLVDYLAMDIKSDADHYENAVSAKVDFKKLEKSAKLIMTSGLPYEFRTTMVPGLVDKEIFLAMGSFIKGAKKWYLQNFKSDTNLVDADFKNQKSFSLKEMKEFVRLGRDFVEFCDDRSGD